MKNMPYKNLINKMFLPVCIVTLLLVSCKIERVAPPDNEDSDLELNFIDTKIKKQPVLPVTVVVESSKPLHIKVGKKMSEGVSLKARDYFCLQIKQDIYIRDVMNPSKEIYKNNRKKAKYAIFLPWLFETESKTGSKTGYSDDELFRRMTGNWTSNTAIPHELAHQVFFKYIMKEQSRPSEYGSIAPDWLDEIAAILFETDFMAQQRRVSFFQYYRDGKVYTLDEFLAMQNKTEAQNINKETLFVKDGETYRIKNKNANSNVSDNKFDSDIFYTQSRIFADYLIDRSGETCIFADIGNYIAKGNDFEDWLIQQQYLPDIVGIEDLQQDYNKWIEKVSKKTQTLDEWINSIASETK